MKTLKYIAMAACCLVLTTACEDFLDVNQTQDAPTSVTLDQSLPVATFYAAQVCYDHAEYGVYMAQALTTSAKATTGSYPYSQGWEFLGVNRHPMWRRHFYDLGTNIDNMVRIAREQGSKNYELIGRTIMLQSTLFTTDIFGEMPRSEAYKATSPKYDSQEEVYAWLFEEADNLVREYAAYNQPNSAESQVALPISEKADRIYKGDMKKWGAYAKALRCRIWLRKLPNWDNTPTTAKKIADMAEDVLTDPNWEEPRYNYPGGKVEQNCPWGPAAPVINSWESRGNRLASSIPTTFFAKGILGAYTRKTNANRYALDPRAEQIMTPRLKGTTAGSDLLRYLESNYGMDVNDKTTYYPDLLTQDGSTNPFVSNTSYIALMLQEELLFIKAEAQYWAKDINGAYNTTLQAVEHNMDRYNVKRASGNDLKRYNLFLDVKLPGAAEFTIADLMQQKYVAMYLQPEQWTDLRRYNYSSSTNGLQYGHGTADAPAVFVYVVDNCHDGKVFKVDNFKVAYPLRRPFNLYPAYWDQPDCYDPKTGLLSEKAWVNRLNPDTETETKYNREELIRLGSAGYNDKGDFIVDYHWMQRPMIWQVKEGFND